MLNHYIDNAMRLAHFEYLADGEGVFGSIPPLRGVWANEPTVESCRAELRVSLEDWLVFSLARGERLPVLDGIDLTVPHGWRQSGAAILSDA